MIAAHNAGEHLGRDIPVDEGAPAMPTMIQTQTRPKMSRRASIPAWMRSAKFRRSIGRSAEPARTSRTHRCSQLSRCRKRPMTQPALMETDQAEDKIGQCDLPSHQAEQQTQRDLIDHWRGDQEREGDAEGDARRNESDEQRLPPSREQNGVTMPRLAAAILPSPSRRPARTHGSVRARSSCAPRPWRRPPAPAASRTFGVSEDKEAQSFLQGGPPRPIGRCDTTQSENGCNCQYTANHASNGHDGETGRPGVPQCRTRRRDQGERRSCRGPFGYGRE